MVNSSLQKFFHSLISGAYLAWLLHAKWHYNISGGLKVRALTCPSKTQHFFWPRQTVVDSFVHTELSSCCIPYICISFVSQKYSLTFSCGICWYYPESIAHSAIESCTAAPSHDTPTSMLHSWVRLFYWNAMFSLSPNAAFLINCSKVLLCQSQLPTQRCSNCLLGHSGGSLANLRQTEMQLVFLSLMSSDADRSSVLSCW